MTLLRNPQIVDVDFGGAAGGAKTWTVCLWMVSECFEYPGIRIGLGRKELTRLKQTTLTTLLREVHPALGILPEEFTYQDQKGLVTYLNGSQIQLVDLIRQPSDPDFDTLGSLNFTHVVIEEAGEVHEKARIVFGSRKNRFMNNEYNLVGKTVLTQNPSQNFTRKEFYEPYKALGMGNYQKWPVGDIEINGVLKTAYAAFIKSLPTDNPFLPQNYIENLKRLPPQERKRLLEGNWDYMDNDDMLFTAQLIDRAMIGQPSAEGRSYIGVDVADKGKDKTIVTLMRGGVIVKQQRLQVDTTGEKAISEAYALELIKFAQQNGFTAQQAKDIAIESNGVGVGMRDFMRSKGWFITEYVATSKTRSQGYYDFAQHMDNGKVKFYSQLETISELRKQLMVITFEFKENLEPKILEKKKIKEVLGYSPDESDSAMITDWIANQQVAPQRVFY